MHQETTTTRVRAADGFPWLRVCLSSAAVWLFIAVLAATPMWVGTPEDEPYPPFFEKLAQAAPAPLVWIILTPLACWWSHRHPIRRPLGSRLFRAHAVGLLMWLVANIMLLVPARFLLQAAPVRVEGIFGEWGLLSWWWYTLLERVGGEIVVYLAIVALWSALENATHAARLSRQMTEARLQALTSQVHPHFLFNTLNTIAEMAESGESKRVRAMTIGLSDLLRRSLQTGSRRLISLGEELEFLEAYLEIEQMRLGDRVAMHIAVPSETLGTLVPPMILQPIVENAVKHGAARTTANATIEITAHLDGDRLEIDVVNSPGRLDAADHSTGIGLQNVRDRLRELYAEGHAFSMTQVGDGVRVRLSIPRGAHEQAEGAI